MNSPKALQPEIIFIKLGGSLITDKARPSTHRPGVLRRLADELRAFRDQNSDTRILLGHGSGSFGHVPAHRFGTRRGVSGPEGWHGFAEVWYQAARLNRFVMQALHDAGIDAISLPPSATLVASDGALTSWELAPLRAALKANLLPVIFGDVIFDSQRGGTIYSTEDLFGYLIPELQPARVLLAGIEPGVCSDYPDCRDVLPAITPGDLADLEAFIAGAYNTDVTGGMLAKVRQSLDWIRGAPNLEVRIFSGHNPGNLLDALNGKRVGTRLGLANEDMTDRI